MTNKDKRKIIGHNTGTRQFYDLIMKKQTPSND